MREYVTVVLSGGAQVTLGLPEGDRERFFRALERHGVDPVSEDQPAVFVSTTSKMMASGQPYEATVAIPLGGVVFAVQGLAMP